MNQPHSPLRPHIAGTPVEVAATLDDFADDLRRFEAGKISDAVFLENRLRYGVYGQRQDGVHMMRSKIPLGLLDAAQLEAFADVAERFGNGRVHLTTRQDLQTHFVALESTPDLMRTLAAEGIISHEACGNVVRNVTASAVAGVAADEAFDVTPYGIALARFLLGHPETKSLGRKLKISLAGSGDPRFDLAAFHDIGLTAKVQDGARGFRVVVGGGLGPVPHAAALLHDFLPVAELLPVALAIVRVFAQRGEKANRARARMKFLVAQMGVEAFAAEVAAQRATLADDASWRAHLTDAALHAFDDGPLHPTAGAWPSPPSADDAQWLRTNVVAQRQAGYAAVCVRVPCGDLTPEQLRGIATLLGAHTGNTLRVGLDQSLWIRWVPFQRLLPLRRDLQGLGLGRARAGGLGDSVVCPGAETCKLGITRPRMVARSLDETLTRLAQDPRLESLRIHVSGCPNACAQHHTADIGLYGAARTIEGVPSPHYMLFLGGFRGGAPVELGPPGLQLAPADGFGVAVAKIPAHRVGSVIELLCQLYLDHAQGADGAQEPFGHFARRLGLRRIKDLLAPAMVLASPRVAPELHREPGMTDAFLVQRGDGECAGAAVFAADLLLKDADREAERAVDAFAEGAAAGVIAQHADAAMLLAVRALLAADGIENDDRQSVVDSFEARFYRTGRIPEGTGYYFIARQSEGGIGDGDRLRRLASEASLFVEEAHRLVIATAAEKGGAS